MRVKHLIEALLEIDGDLPVLLAGDEEGNSFSPAGGVDIATCNREMDDVGVAIEDAKENGDYGPEDVMAIPCVLIWPGVGDD